jgi:flagellar protein FlaI
LYPYANDAEIEDLSYNGSGSLFVYHQSEYKSILSNLKIPQKEVDQFLTQLLENFGCEVDDGKLVDNNLTDNERIIVTFGSDDGLEDTTFTLKTDDSYSFTPVDLYESGTYSSTAVSYLWMAVDNDMSILFGGGTASGKTSTLEAILFFTENNQKVISVEDRQEISIPHKNWIPNNNANDENIDISDLLMSSIRQRPKYIVLDEIRGGSEAQTLFQAISTGHTSYSTIHADSLDSVINRLINPPINVPKQMLISIDIICIQNQSNVDSGTEPSRRVKEIREVIGLRDNGEFHSERPFRWNSKNNELTNSIEDSYIVNEISRLSQMNTQDVIGEIKQREKIIEEMSRSDIRDAESVREVITIYQDSPELVMKKLENGNLEKLL